MRWSLAVLLVSLGCGTPSTDTAGDDPVDTDEMTSDSEPVDDTDDPTPTGSTETGDTGTWDVPPWEAMDVDCTAGNDLPFDYETLSWAPPAEDFTFDDEGYLISVTGGLKRTPYGGPSELLVPNFPDVRGTRILPDGRVAMAAIDQASIYVVDPDTGGQTVPASGLVNPNGIAIGVDGLVYVTVSAQILRIHPDTGDIEVVVDMPNHSFDGISFSPDFTRLYFNEEFGRIHWVDFDENGVPGQPQQGPSIPIGAFSILDGMAVDACGNLYTTEMGGKVWRITPDGQVDLVFDAREAFAVVPALNFGMGGGAYDPEILYVMDFKGALYAVDVGIPGKWEPHLPYPTP